MAIVDLPSFANGIIISCQAPVGSPLRDPHVMARMALAAEKAGAVGIRAEGAMDIAAIRAAVTLPIIGIRKEHSAGSEVFITATRADVDIVADAGASIVALDASSRYRANDEKLASVIAHAHERGLVVMADLTGFDDAEGAIIAGADIVGTTLVASSEHDIRSFGPNLDVLQRLATAYPNVPLIAEGRYASAEDVMLAFEAGATSIVVGRAVTDSYALASDLVEAARGYTKRH